MHVSESIYEWINWFTFCSHASSSSSAMKVVNLESHQIMIWSKISIMVQMTNILTELATYLLKRTYWVHREIKHDNMINIQIQSPSSQVSANQCRAISIFTLKFFEILNPANKSKFCGVTVSVIKQMKPTYQGSTRIAMPWFKKSLNYCLGNFDYYNPQEELHCKPRHNLKVMKYNDLTSFLLAPLHGN